MTRVPRSLKVRILNSALLLLVILSAQFIVLTHTHDPLHHNADVVCKVCVSGDHLGHGLVHAAGNYAIAVGLVSPSGFVTLSHPIVFFTHALARAPPTYS